MAKQTRDRFEEAMRSAIEAVGRRATPAAKPYLTLLSRFRLRPLASEADLRQALALADELFDRGDLGKAEEEYLDVLCDLIEAYEDEHHPIPDVSGRDMLRFLISQRAVTQQRVAREAGIENSTLTALLNGRRQMTIKHMERFASYFGVNAAVFLPGNGPEVCGPAWQGGGGSKVPAAGKGKPAKGRETVVRLGDLRTKLAR